MIIYLVGLNCVGTSTVGKMLAEKLNFKLYDLPYEMQNHYNESIERIHNKTFNLYGCTELGSVVLDKIFAKREDAIVIGMESGLKYVYLNTLKKHKKKNPALYSVYLHDTAENISHRMRFYDIDTNPIEVEIDEPLRKRYVREIKKDFTFFKSSYQRADIQVDIENVKLENIPDLIMKKLKDHIEKQNKE